MAVFKIMQLLTSEGQIQASKGSGQGIKKKETNIIENETREAEVLCSQLLKSVGLLHTFSVHKLRGQVCSTLII